MRYVKHTNIKTKPIKASGETEDAYEDRVEAQIAKDLQASTYILRNLSVEISDTCLGFKTAKALQQYLIDYYSSIGAVEEY